MNVHNGGEEIRNVDLAISIDYPLNFFYNVITMQELA